MKRMIAAWIAAVSMLPTTHASAADIKVISAGAVRTLIAGMIEAHKKQAGDTFDITIGTTGQLRVVPSRLQTPSALQSKTRVVAVTPDERASSLNLVEGFAAHDDEHGDP